MTKITGNDTVTGVGTSLTIADPHVVTSAPAVPFGCTVAGGSTLSQVKTWYQNWSSLVSPIGLAKVYFQGKSNPPPTTVASAGAQVQALAALGIPTILCFEPLYYGTVNDTTWPGGANKPAMGTYAAGNTGTVLGDSFDMVATVNGLKATGLNVYGSTMWQECDNFSKYSHEMTADSSAPAPVANQVTYLYYAHYQKLHAACPVICSYGGYQQGLYDANQGNTLMPFKTFLRPNDPAYCDSVTIDRYADGYHNLATTPYSQGPGVVPTSSQRWGYGDLADFAGLPFGWIEAGNSASAGNNPAENYMVQYLVSGSYTDPQTNITYPGDPVNSIQATFQYRMQQGLPSAGFAWYQNNGNASGANLILSAPDFRIDLLRRLAATLAA